MRYGFLGPETTFTHQALLQALTEIPEEFRAEEPELVPFASVATATTDLLAGEIDALMAPIENSVEGGVPATLDALTRYGHLQIVAEAVVPVRFVLAARPGACPPFRAVGYNCPVDGLLAMLAVGTASSSFVP